MELLLQGGNTLRFGDFRAVCTVRHVKRVRSRTVLGADTGKCDRYAFASQAGKQIVEETETVPRLDLNQSVGRVRLVIDCNSRRKFHILCRTPQTLTPRFIDYGPEIKVLFLQGVPERFFHQIEVSLVGYGATFGVANMKNVENGVIPSSKSVHA